MLKKLTLICLLCTCLVVFTIGTTGCSQGPDDVVVDKSLKEKKLGTPGGEDRPVEVD